MGESNNDIWVVAYSAGKAFIGKVAEAHVPGVSVMDGTSCLNIYDKNIEKKDVLDAKRLKLLPVYDLLAPMRPVQVAPGQIGYSRDPLVTPIDFAMEDVPLYVKTTAIMFFDDMTPKDRATYEGFVKGAESQKQEERVKRSGLHLPTK